MTNIKIKGISTRVGDFFVLIFNRLVLIKKTMTTYCVKCAKKTENLGSKISKTKNGRLIMQSKLCCVWN